MRILLYILYCAAVLAAVFFLAEGVVRLAGDKPYVPVTFNIQVEPGGKFFAPHPTLGYAHLPGAFKITLPTGYTFTVTHGADTLRLTEPPATTAAAGNRPEIWIFGCSITHAWAVNDADAYPWLLQEQLPQYRVVNFGVDGYSNVQGLVQLEESLAQGRVPQVVIAAYGSLHDTRNICSRLYRKAVIPHNRLGELLLPCGRLDNHGNLQIIRIQLGYEPLPFMGWSAFIHRLEQVYLKNEGKFRHSREVSRAILLRMAGLCRDRGITFVAAGVKDDRPTREMLAFLRKHGILAVDVAVDLNLPQYNNRPHDGHPSPRAHRLYADKLAQFLQGHPPLVTPSPPPDSTP
jgi:hypothetical protein